MSDIINAINTANEPKKKAVVNHSGSCAGYHFQAGVEVDLPESVIKALGSDAEVVGEVKPQPAPVQEPKKEVPQPPVDKTLGKEDAATK